MKKIGFKFVLVIFAGIALSSYTLCVKYKDLPIKPFQQKKEVVEAKLYEISKGNVDAKLPELQNKTSFSNSANESPKIIDKNTQKPESNGSSETSNRSSETSNRSSETSNGSSETSNGSSETSNRSSETSNGSSETSNRSSETSNRSSETSNESSETSNKSSEISNGSLVATSNGSLATSNNIETKVLQSPEKVILPIIADEIVYKDSFENGLGNIWWREMTNDIYAGTISSKYAREGTYSYRIELQRSDPIVYAGKRSEISISEPEPVADERIYNFSVYLPKGESEDYALDPNGDDIIAQWHNTPDLGEEGTYPPLALHTRGDGHYALERNWDADPMSTEEKMDREGTKAITDLGSYLDDKGKWVDWTFHVKWGWLVSQHPIIQIYKNGILVFELKDEPNTTNDKLGIRMKLGIYKWEWGQTGELSNLSILSDRVVYYDNVMVKQVGSL